MFSFNSSSGFQGSGYIYLNVVRALNIIILQAVAAACILMMVFAKMPNGYTFFADVSLFFIVCACFLLTWSELPIKAGKSWIANHFPVISEGFGFTWFGVTMFVMGCHTLGALSHEPFTPETIPLPIWQLIIAAGILAMIAGVLNIVSSLVFKNKEAGITAREVRNYGATTAESVAWASENNSQRAESIYKEKPKPSRINRLTGVFTKKKMDISGPIGPVQHDGASAHGDSYPVNERGSPIVPGIDRPPTALHPLYYGGRRSSHYSEVSHLDRYGDKMI
ncbi:hypothetical protein MN608_01052 [Microdochium nivale]|nr:hypothetical protein MN608_01052 [Microdochium nivale]